MFKVGRDMAPLVLVLDAGCRVCSTSSPLNRRQGGYHAVGQPVCQLRCLGCSKSPGVYLSITRGHSLLN